MKQGKAESSTDAHLTDESFSLLNFHMGSGIGGVLLIVAVLALGGVGYGLVRLRNGRKDLDRLAATTLDVHVRGEGEQTTLDKIQKCQSFVTIV